MISPGKGISKKSTTPDAKGTQPDMEVDQLRERIAGMEKVIENLRSTLADTTRKADDGKKDLDDIRLSVSALWEETRHMRAPLPPQDPLTTDATTPPCTTLTPVQETPTLPAPEAGSNPVPIDVAADVHSPRPITSLQGYVSSPSTSHHSPEPSQSDLADTLNFSFSQNAFAVSGILRELTQPSDRPTTPQGEPS